MRQHTKGIACMLFSAASFSLMNVCAHMAGDLPAMQKSFFRNLIALGVSLLLITIRKAPFRIPKGQFRHLFSRSFFGTIGVVCNYYAVDHMFLSDATMLNKMSPFFSALFAVWLLKETITWVHVSFLSVAFVGCAFILKPGVEGLLSPEAGVALLGGLCAGIAYTEVRKLGTGGVDKNWIILFFSAFSCICALPFLVFDYAPMTASQLLFLILAGLTATGGQFGVTAAYCYVAAAEISIYDYSQIIFAALFGYLFFAQIPDLYSVVGYIIVCAAAIGIAMYSEKRNQKIEQDGREIR